MITVDKDKIEEIKAVYDEKAKREIAKAVQDPDTELSDEDIQAIKNRWKFISNKEVDKVMNLNPEKLFKKGLSEESGGWREGYTKPLIEQRAKPRRAKNKQARKTRRQQNKRK